MTRAGRWVLPTLVLLFLCGVLQLWRWRFDIGDIYPEYSSLRADPLGTRALFDSLEGAGIAVTRSYGGVGDIQGKETVTVLSVGWTPRAWWATTTGRLQEWDRFLRGGGRLVLAFSPEDQEALEAWLSEDGWRMRGDPGAESNDEERDSFTVRSPPENRWGVRVRFAALEDGEPCEVSLLTSGAGLPDRLWWRTGLTFSEPTADWSVLYRREDYPVILWRRIGDGVLVLAADAYVLSNEGLWRDRQPELLSWMVGRSRRVVFEEEQLGLHQSPGIGSLIRRYRLRGVLAGLLALAVLYVWMVSSPLVPLVREEPDQGIIGGHDTATGLENLLHRNLPRTRLLEICWEAWKDSLPRRERSSDRVRRAESVVRSGGEATRAYAKMARILSARRSG